MEGNLERRFFKVMMPGFDQILRLPPSYSAEIRDEKGRKVTLESHKGKWEMKLRRQTNEISLGDGWPRFVRDHALSVGDFLVFQRQPQRHFHFKVSVFAPSASENLFQPPHLSQVGGIARQFFKIMLPGLFEEKLKLPPAFCEEIKQGKSKTAILESRKGRWKMDVCRKDDEIYLQDGWPQFADCHALSDGDLLVFEHSRHFHFHVAVFDTSACEKMFVAEPKKQHPPCEEAKSKAPSCSCSKTKRRLHPFFTVKITAFSSTRGAKASIPKEFAIRNKLMKKRGLILRDEGGRRWEVTLEVQQRITRLRMGTGWDAFCGGNELKAGDICVFELHPSSLSSTTILLDATCLKL